MSKSTIGGPLDLAALSALAGDTERMRHFRLLDHTQRAQAIQRLAATGMSDHGMAAATGLAVDQIRRVLAEHLRPEASS